MEEATNEQVNNDYQAILDGFNQLHEDSVSTNNSIKELTEFLIIQSNNEQNEKAVKADQEKQEALEQGETELLKEQEESARAEEQSAQAETYTELLTDIRDELDFANQVYAGQILFMGIICGLLIGKILLDRFMKL